MSEGTYDPDERSAIESLWFGDIGHHPVYGYWHSPRQDVDGREHPAVSGFGNVVFHMKPGVRDRTTASLSDSLVYNRDGVPFIPSVPLSEDYSFINMEVGANILDRKDFLMSDRFPYMEAQVHGKLSLDDVAMVTIHPYAQDNDRKSSMLTNFITMLNAAGIKYNIVE